MHILHAIHPTAPGAVIKLFHTRRAAEIYGRNLLMTIGNALVERHEQLRAEPHPKAEAWATFMCNIGAPFVVWSTFVEGLDNRDEEDRDWLVEIVEQGAQDEREAAERANEVIGDELAGGGASISVFSDISTDRVEIPLMKSGERLDVQALDPAGELIATMIGSLAWAAGMAEEAIAMREESDDEDDTDPDTLALHKEGLESARAAIAEAQAWLDKARPIGQIANDVVRLAGIIVAGTDLHACLSEAVEEPTRFYEAMDEQAGRFADPADCSYAAALKGWTAALAGITVTTPAPPRSV